MHREGLEKETEIRQLQAKDYWELPEAKNNQGRILP